MSYIKPEKRLFTTFEDFYRKLCDGSDSKFNGKAELFVVGLVLGFLNNKRNLSERPFEMVRYSHFLDKKRSDLRTIIEMIYATTAKGNDENEKWQDMLKIADGGIDSVISTRRLDHIAKAFAIFNDKAKSIELCCARFDSDTKESFLDLYSKIDAGINPLEEVSEETIATEEESEF
mgnify:CR=1 FL=1